MQGCSAPLPGDPLVQSLLGSTDCHVQSLVRTGYGALLGSGGGLSSALTILLTIYVALIGYRLLLGRSQLNVSDFALSAIKIGAVVALATQWETYQTVVYRVLFDGPQQAAEMILNSLGGHGSAYGGNLFTGLQHAFDDLTAFSPANPPGAPATPPAPPTLAPALASSSPIAASLGPAGQGGAQISALLTKPGFDSLLMLSSALLLLLSTLGVLLVSKIVLAILLALGPVFIALFLFDSTRGLFEGWLRASLAFAFAPLATLLTLGLGLTLLGPSLTEIEAMIETHTYTPNVAFGVLVLVIVMAGVSLGMMAAASVVAAGLKLPKLLSAQRTAAATGGSATATATVSEPARAERVATAAAAQERRDAAIFGRSAGGAAVLVAEDRRAAAAAPRSAPERTVVAPETRLGQAPRRNAQPRALRGLRSEA